MMLHGGKMPLHLKLFTDLELRCKVISRNGPSRKSLLTRVCGRSGKPQVPYFILGGTKREKRFPVDTLW